MHSVRKWFVSGLILISMPLYASNVMICPDTVTVDNSSIKISYTPATIQNLNIRTYTDRIKTGTYYFHMVYIIGDAANNLSCIYLLNGKPENSINLDAQGRSFQQVGAGWSSLNPFWCQSNNNKDCQFSYKN